MAMLGGIDSTYRMSASEAALLLALTVACAFALHAFWERPARALIRSLFLTPSPKPERGQS